MERGEEPWACAQANLECEMARRICRALEVGEWVEVETIGVGLERWLARLLEGLRVRKLRLDSAGNGELLW